MHPPLMLLSAAPGQMPSINIPQGNAIGVTSTAMFGALLLVAAYWSTSLEVGFVRGKASGGLDKWTQGKFDWRSFVYWALGFIALVAILGSGGGPMAEVAEWFQAKVANPDWFDFLNPVIKLILCVGLIYMALKKRAADEARGDLIWGTACALIIPIMAEFGAPGACLIMLLMAMKNRGDSRNDIYWGIGCGIMFPLGGGGWTEACLQASHLIAEVITWGNAS